MIVLELINLNYYYLVLVVKFVVKFTCFNTITMENIYYNQKNSFLIIITYINIIKVNYIFISLFIQFYIIFAMTAA